MVLLLKKQYHFQQAQHIFQTFMKHISQLGKGKVKESKLIQDSYREITKNVHGERER